MGNNAFTIGGDKPLDIDRSTFKRKSLFNSKEDEE